MKTITQKIHQWGLDRKIIQHGDFETQRLKLWSEFGEMCDSLAKGQCPKDDIGDQYVVLVMMHGIQGSSRSELARAAEQADKNTIKNIDSSHTVRALARAYFSGQNWTQAALYELADIAAAHGLTLKECAEHAYNEIKDRKGFLNEHGVFVKEES